MFTQTLTRTRARGVSRGRVGRWALLRRWGYRRLAVKLPPKLAKAPARRPVRRPLWAARALSAVGGAAGFWVLRDFVMVTPS